jgi:hypothetical protein
VRVGELRFTGIKDCALLGLRVFDARIRAPVGIGGYSQDARGGGCRVECSAALWHDTPVELVLDLATGLDRTFELPRRRRVFFMKQFVRRFAPPFTPLFYGHRR